MFHHCQPASNMETKKKQTHRVKLFTGPPRIKDRDTRCSTKGVQNWSKFGDKPPLGHYCECTKPRIILT